MKRRIMIDVDDVSLNFIDYFLAFYNHKCKKGYKKEDIHSYQLSDVFNLSERETVSLIEMFYQSERFWELPAIDGAFNFVNYFSKNSEIFAITARPLSTVEATKYNLNLAFGQRIKTIIHSKPTSDEFADSQHLLEKPQICQRNGITFAVEDSLSNAKEISKTGIPVYLLDQPWNQCEEIENIKRVYSLNEILMRVN